MLARFFVRQIDRESAKKIAATTNPNFNFVFTDTLKTMTGEQVEKILTSKEKKFAEKLEDNGLIDAFINSPSK